MFNPNSAFPRQTTYIPQPYGYGPMRAVNAPNFAPTGGGGVGGLPNTAAAYAAMVQHGAQRAAGAPGIQRGTAGIAERPNGMIDQFRSRVSQDTALRRQNAARRHARAGSPSLPEVDDIAEKAAAVISDGKTPLSSGIILPAGVSLGSARPSTFNEMAGQPSNLRRTFSRIFPRTTS